MLPPETENVWKFLAEQRSLAGFVLNGGAALVLRMGHRTSKDLDLAYPELALSRAKIDELIQIAKSAGLILEPNDNQAALDEAFIAGMELHDYQQDFVVNNAVKVSFFTPEACLSKVPIGKPEEKIRVAALSELFNSKCLSSAKRSNTRDWLDLYLLMRDRGFTRRDYRDALRLADTPGQTEISLGRLCKGTPGKTTKVTRTWWRTHRAWNRYGISSPCSVNCSRLIVAFRPDIATL